MGKAKRVILGALLIGLVFPGFSMYIMNYSEYGFDDGTGQTTGLTAKSSGVSMSVKDLIINSGTYFLKGKSSIDLLSSRLEGADHDGVNFYEYQTLVNNALCDMRAARYYYQALKDRANITPYNQGVINQLAAFDYNSFSKEYGLNGDIFGQVTGYLQAGDIRGAYARMYTHVDTIIDYLETIQREVYYYRFPETANIWKLNQECASMLLFGQYVAQVFYKIP